MACQKEVIDFSVMSDREILAHISTASSNICGRAANDQLDRDLMVPREPTQIGWRYWISLAASFLLVSAKSEAQNGKVLMKPVVYKPFATKKGKSPILLSGEISGVVINDRKVQIIGRVIDDHSNPVSFASIRINGSSSGIAADAEGNFILNKNIFLAGIELKVSSVGYESKTIKIDSLENAKPSITENGIIKIFAGDILLTVPGMKEVVVVADNLITGRAGGIVIGVRVTRLTRAKNAFKDVMVVSEIKVYPNPITPNSVFNISLNVKDQGAYSIQFTDVSGKIIAALPISITAKNQLESFNSNLFRSSGTYFVSLVNKQNGKVYTTKLMVQ